LGDVDGKTAVSFGHVYRRGLGVQKLGDAFVKARYVGLAIVFVWFFVGGVTHFTNASMFVRIVPPYIPFAPQIVFVTGVFELLGAIGIWLPRWRQSAGNGLFLLTVCVTPANLYMWMHPRLFSNIHPELLFWRLPMQIALLACIWWATRAPRSL
jgi:uncharacterized membrane protein